MNQTIIIFFFFSTKQAKNFDGEFSCLGENVQKILNLYPVPIKKEIKRIDKRGGKRN